MGIFDKKSQVDKQNQYPGEAFDEIKKAVEEEKPVPPLQVVKNPQSFTREFESLVPEFTSESKPEPKPEFKPVPKPIETRLPERPPIAPLFIRLEKYKQIIDSLTNLKGTVVVIKNSLSALSELDKAKEDAFRLIQDAVIKLDRRISVLDQEFIRPPGIGIEERFDFQDVEVVGNTISDLKGQIEQLKTELDTMS